MRTEPVVDCFTAAHHHAKYDQRLDLLQRANEAKESRRFKVREEAVA